MRTKFFKRTREGYSKNKNKRIIIGTRKEPFCYIDNLWRSKDNEIWLPVAVAAYLIGMSAQTIRLLYLTGQIKGVKYSYSSLLVDVNEIETLKRGDLTAIS